MEKNLVGHFALYKEGSMFLLYNVYGILLLETTSIGEIFNYIAGV